MLKTIYLSEYRKGLFEQYWVVAHQRDQLWVQEKTRWNRFSAWMVRVISFGHYDRERDSLKQVAEAVSQAVREIFSGEYRGIQQLLAVFGKKDMILALLHDVGGEGHSILSWIKNDARFSFTLDLQDTATLVGEVMDGNMSLYQLIEWGLDHPQRAVIQEAIEIVFDVGFSVRRCDVQMHSDVEGKPLLQWLIEKTSNANFQRVERYIDLLFKKYPFIFQDAALDRFLCKDQFGPFLPVSQADQPDPLWIHAMKTYVLEKKKVDVRKKTRAKTVSASLEGSHQQVRFSSNLRKPHIPRNSVSQLLKDSGFFGF